MAAKAPLCAHWQEAMHAAGWIRRVISCGGSDNSRQQASQATRTCDQTTSMLPGCSASQQGGFDTQWRPEVPPGFRTFIFRA